MTISTTTSSVTLSGDGSNTAWNYSFLIPNSTDVEVSTVVSSVTTVIDPSLYTITTNNPAGGTVTYPLSGSPLVAGSTITIKRVLPLTQTTELTNQSNFDPSVVEGALDYLTMLIQDLNTDVGDLNLTAIIAAANALTASVSAFNEVYLGEHATDPTATGSGGVLVAGQLYFNTTSNVMKVYDGASWLIAYNPSTALVNSFNGRTGVVLPASGDYAAADITGLGGAAVLNVGTTAGTVAAGDIVLVKANNLSDVASAATTRTNLGLLVTPIQTHDITTNITSYDIVLPAGLRFIRIVGIISAVSNAIWLRVSTDGGATFDTTTDYTQSITYNANGTWVVGTTASATGFHLSASNAGTDISQLFNTILHLGTSTTKPWCKSQWGTYNAGLLAGTSDGWRGATGAVNAIRLFTASGGNMTDGRIMVEGF